MFQVPENCCSENGQKWSRFLTGVQPGMVCCNSPCKEAADKKCPMSDYCLKKKVQGRSLSPYADPYSLGFATLGKNYAYGTNLQDIYTTNVNNYDQFKVLKNLAFEKHRTLIDFLAGLQDQ